MECILRGSFSCEYLSENTYWEGLYYEDEEEYTIDDWYDDWLDNWYDPLLNGDRDA